ncbi:MAG: sigma-70 family RNA polymerase sigma factor [Planctomycetes bacterium]|nr:sigma-70 family RNA polymerase sigma factor [Planctomycetota bacterium]
MGPYDPPDEALVERAVGGDKDAFGLLAERYYRMISVLAYQKTGHRADAEDIVQEALVRAFRALADLRDPRKFASWLYNITLKLCIDWSRRRERRGTPMSLEEETLSHKESGRFPRAQQPVGQSLENAEEHGRVIAAVAALPDRYRIVMTLRYVEKMSYKEISEHLGEPTGTIANRLHRAMKMVQERLGTKVEGA